MLAHINIHAQLMLDGCIVNAGWKQAIDHRGNRQWEEQTKRASAWR